METGPFKRYIKQVILPRLIEDVGKNNIKPHLSQENCDIFLQKSNYAEVKLIKVLLKDEFKDKKDFYPDTDNPTYRSTNLETYLSLITMRNQENQNQDKSSEKYKQYQVRLKELVKMCRGITLDIGADNYDDILEMLPQGVKYIGITPDGNHDSKYSHESILTGIGEFLPFKSEVIDSVMFNTSLDHILDANLAISEASRVLKSNGRILISTLVWIKNVELWRDDVHFHHFKPSEIEGLLEGFKIEYLATYDYNNEKHRYGAFISARKISI